MTTEYFRVRNGLAVGEDTFTVDATTGNVVVEGNLTVNGATTTLNTTELNVEDNKITLNSNVSGTPTLDSGIIVERGTSDNVEIRWNETTDKWQFTNDGTTYADFSNVQSVNTQTGAVVLDTDDVSEGATNKYYTTTRFDDRLATKTTDNLTEGSTNLYYTDARADARVSAGISAIDYPVDSVNGQTNTVVLDTDDVSEGATNKYFSNTLARQALSASTGVTYDNSTGVISIGQDVATTAKPTFTSLTATRTVTAGGKAVDSNGDVLIAKTSNASSQIPVAAFFDNSTANRKATIVSREYGQNAGNYTSSTTVGNATMIMEASRGTATAPTVISTSNNTLGGFGVGYYDGTRWTSESGLSNPVAWVGQNTEATASETSVFTGSISGNTLTVSAVTSGEIHAGQLITGTGINSGTTITAYGTNTFGGVGTYTISPSAITPLTNITITGVGTKSGGGRLIGVITPNNNKASATSRQTYYVTANTKPIAPVINGVPVPQNSSLSIIQGNIDSGDTTFVSTDGQTVYKGRGQQTMSLNQMSLYISGVAYNDEARFTGYIDNGSGGTGNTLTVTAVESGVLYVGQKIVASALSTKTPYFITALGTGTGGTGTYTVASTFQTAGTILGSSSSPVSIIGTPDDYGMRGSNSINIFSSRKSTINGRRAPLKNGDDIFNFNAAGQTGSVGNFEQASIGAMNFNAAEDFTTSKAGSRFSLVTTNIGTLNQANRLVASNQNITLNSDTFTFQDSDYNTNLTIDTDGNVIISRGSLTTNGNITATNFYGDGSGLTNLPSQSNQSLNTTSSPTFVDTTVKNIIKGQIRNHPTGLTSGDIYANYNNVAAYQGVLIDNTADITKRAGIVLRGVGNRAVTTTERSNGTASSPTNLVQGNGLWESHGTGWVGGSDSGWIADKVAQVPALVRTLAGEAWDDGLNKTGARFQVVLQPPSTTLTTTSPVVVQNYGADFGWLQSDSHTFKNKSGTDLVTINSVGEVTATKFYGDGSGLTNLASPFNQTLNTGDNVTFAQANLFGNWNNNAPLGIDATLLDTQYQAGGTINFQTRYKASQGATTYSVPAFNWSIGKFAFQGSANTSGTTDVLAGQMLCQATESWSSTNHGTKFIFTANRDGQTWQNGSDVVLTLKPENVYVKTDSFTVGNSTNTTKLSVDTNKVKSYVPIEFAVYTATQANAITGSVGQQICVSNSSSGSNPNGMMAFWDTTNSRWSYIHDNSAV